MPIVSSATHAWRYNETSFKASHNSYSRLEQPCTSQLLDLGKRLSEGRCRGLELDLSQSPSQWCWSVDHDVYRIDADDQFAEYLIQLRDFSSHYRGHDVITVILDLKHEATDVESFPWRLDAYIDRYLGAERLYRPADLQGDAPDLVRGAMSNHWPLLGDEKLRGKFILCLSGDEKTKARYAKDGKDRLCFADINIGKPAEFAFTGKGTRVFVNCDMRSIRDWSAIQGWMCAKRGLVVRGYVIDDKELWKSALDAQVNILATNKVCQQPWATVGQVPFARTG